MKRFVFLAAIWSIMLLATASAQRPANSFYLKSGDRVVFYGDSITDQRLYTTFVETYVLTRYPALDVSFVHSGWGGDRVTGGGGGKVEQRLERDVLAYRPTVITIMLGMNDASYKAYDQAVFDIYSNGYEGIVKRLKAALPAVRMTLIQPSPFDDVTRPPTFEGGYNAVLLRYGQFVKQLAEREHLDAADLNTSVVAALQKAHIADPATAQKIVPDRVHPGPGGHLLMAAALLRAWGTPAVVSHLEMDAAAQQATRAERTKVSELKSAAGALSWTQTDDALPFPFDMKDQTLALAVKSSDIFETLNRQVLKVSNLSGANYTLKIDGQEVTTLSKEELAAGVNLATLRTPMLQQAMDVHDLTLKHNNLHFARWRTVQVPLQEIQTPAVKNAMKALDDVEAEVIAQQKTKRQPQPHRFELVPR